MNLYHVKRISEFTWDNYDSFVCLAESEDQARRIYSGSIREHWQEEVGQALFMDDMEYHGDERDQDLEFDRYGWVGEDDIVVTYLGESISINVPWVLCASFNN